MNLVTLKFTVDGVERSVTIDRNLPTVDDGLAFYISQLSNVEAKIYETKYRNIIYQELVPVDTSDPEWVDQISYRSYDAVTMGKFIGANGDDLPQVAMNAKIDHIPVGYGGISFGYTLDELRKSMAMNMAIDAEGGKMSFRGFQEHCQRLAFNGDSARGMYGLFNNPNVQSANSTVDWSTATNDEIVEDLNQPLLDVWENSANVHLADTLGIDSTRWAYIATTRMASGTDTTILEYFMKNNLFTAKTGGQLEIKPILELGTAGTGSVARMIAYEKTPENLVMKLPMPWRTLPPQPKGLRIDVPSEYKVGGVEFRYPGSAAYRDAI